MSYSLTMWIGKPRFNYRLSDLHEVTKGGPRVRGGARIWPESIDSKSISQGHYNFNSRLVIVVQSLNRVWLFLTPWTAACQAPLSCNSRSLLKFMSIELVMLSNHLILCCPLLLCLQPFPASGSFSMNQLFASGGQSVEASAPASVLPVNIQGWFPLGLTSLNHPCRPGDSR